MVYAQVVSYPLTHSLTHLLTHFLTYSLTHSLTHSLTYSLTHSLTHSPTYSPTYLLTYTLTHCNSFAGIGLPLIILLLLVWLVDEKKRQQYLVLSFAINSLIATLLFVANDSPSKRCVSNTVRVDYDDDGVCLAQAYILQYFTLACTLAWCSQVTYSLLLTNSYSLTHSLTFSLTYLLAH